MLFRPTCVNLHGSWAKLFLPSPDGGSVIHNLSCFAVHVYSVSIDPTWLPDNKFNYAEWKRFSLDTSRKTPLDLTTKVVYKCPILQLSVNEWHLSQRAYLTEATLGFWTQNFQLYLISKIIYIFAQISWTAYHLNESIICSVNNLLTIRQQIMMTKIYYTIQFVVRPQ